MRTAGQVGAAARTDRLVGQGEPLRHRRTLACTSWRRRLFYDPGVGRQPLTVTPTSVPALTTPVTGADESAVVAPRVLCVTIGVVQTRHFGRRHIVRCR